ncbi:DUF2705 family protein [Melghirimyces algeriensis]
MTVWDYLFFSLTGISAHLTFLDYLGWVLVVAPILFVTHSITSNTEGFDQMLLFRSNSRCEYWVTKLAANALACIAYSSLLFTIHFCFGLFFFSFETNWGPLFQTSIQSFHPLIGITFLYVHFTLGIMVISILGQTVALFFHHAPFSYIAITIYLTISGQLYPYVENSSFLSLLFYPSLQLLLTEEGSLASLYGTSFFIMLIAIISSFIWIRRQASIL